MHLKTSTSGNIQFFIQAHPVYLSFYEVYCSSFRLFFFWRFSDVFLLHSFSSDVSMVMMIDELGTATVTVISVGRQSTCSQLGILASTQIVVVVVVVVVLVACYVTQQAAMLVGLSVLRSLRRFRLQFLHSS